MNSLKRIGIIIGHPTQFEGPLFQYIAKDNKVNLNVIYYNSERMNSVYDPELQMDLDWGIDLLTGYEYYIVPKKNKFIWLKNKFKNDEYDLLIINGYNQLVLFYSIILGKIFSKSISLRLDTVEFSPKSHFKKLAKKILYKIFDQMFEHFFAIGSLTKKFLISVGIADAKISIFSYAIDNDFFKYNSKLTPDVEISLKDKLKIAENAKVIISVAKFSQREAPWDLVKAFSLIKDMNLHLLLIGDGPLRDELKEYVHNKNIHNVTFTGYVKYSELPKFYGISDLFIHTSNDEPWGVSVQEAMASGLPIITSEFVGASVDLIEKGKNGFTYNSQDFFELKEKLLDALSLNPKEVKKTNDNILNNWNYSSTMDTLLKLLN